MSDESVKLGSEIGHGESTEIVVNGGTGDGRMVVKIGNRVVYDGPVTDGYSVTVEYEEVLDR